MTMRMLTKLADIAEFQFNSFNPNDIAKQIITTLVGLFTVGVFLYGAIHLYMGFSNQDPKDKRDGIIAMLASLVLGGLVITVTNTIIA